MPGMSIALQRSRAILRNDRFYDAAVIAVCCVSFAFSWIESTVNHDSHHWGFVYLPALDLKMGLIPHKEVVTIYGMLTSWIQCLSLMVLGESLKSIGIITGLFYSVSLFLGLYPDLSTR